MELKNFSATFRNKAFIHHHRHDYHETEDPPHGNRNNNKGRAHHRKIPSKIAAMKVNPNKPGVAHKKSVSENVLNDLQNG